MKKENIWIITPKTNLHVGNENTSSYGLIDLAVQRDAITELPCINSSSLKGAINEWASQCEKMNAEQLVAIFGSDKSKREDGKKGLDSKKGGNIFFDANIIALPEPDDKKLFKLITCKEVINACIAKARMLGIDVTEPELKKDAECVSLEDFKNACSDDNLPIIARNVLENGISKNLWYEQIVPAETRFFTIIGRMDDTEDVLTKKLNGKTVQIGANGSIGYGYCKFEHL